MKAARHRRNAAPGDSVPDGLKAIDFRYTEPPEENGEDIGYGRWQPGRQGSGIDEEPRQWYQVDRATGSDYMGGVMVRSNYNGLVAMLEEKHPQGQVPAVWGRTGGGHHTYGLIVVWAELDESIQEAIGGLDEYPVLSDSAYSELQVEQEGELWETFYAREFERQFLKDWNAWMEFEGDDEIEDFPSGFELFSLFHVACEVGNINWEDADDGLSVDHEAAADVAVDLLSGQRDLPDWLMADDRRMLTDLAVALGMERD